MALNVEIVIPKNMPFDKINNYMDLCMNGIARMTLDFTNTGSHFPYRTGELNRASMAEGVVSDGWCNYHLGASGVEYAPDVYEWPQSTNWTNPSTYAQWYDTVFNENEKTILDLAIKQAEQEAFKE